MVSSRITVAIGTLLLLMSAVRCDYNSPTAPSDSAPCAEGAVISITGNGLTPAGVTIGAGQSVTFRNDDTVAHQIASGPAPSYTDCPPINAVGRLEPGQSMQTGALTTTRSCGFLDLLRSGDARWQGNDPVASTGRPGRRGKGPFG